MTIEQIMVGDYLKITEPDKFAGYIGEVKNIGAESKYLTLYLEPYHDIDVFIEDVTPIPITDVFLRMNFEKKTFYGIFDDYFDLDIREYSDGLYIVTYHSCEFNIPDQTIHVSWVHELQHFLNHCGITHEIKL